MAIYILARKRMNKLNERMCKLNIAEACVCYRWSIEQFNWCYVIITLEALIIGGSCMKLSAASFKTQLWSIRPCTTQTFSRLLEPVSLFSLRLWTWAQAHCRCCPLMSFFYACLETDMLGRCFPRTVISSIITLPLLNRLVCIWDKALLCVLNDSCPNAPTCVTIWGGLDS